MPQRDSGCVLGWMATVEEVEEGYRRADSYSNQGWRRERDSNPRWFITTAVFKTAAINRTRPSLRGAPSLPAGVAGWPYRAGTGESIVATPPDTGITTPVRYAPALDAK